MRKIFSFRNLVENYKKVIRVNRTYQKVVIKNIKKFSDNGTKIMKIYGKNIKELRISNCSFDLEDFCNLLEIVSKVESLRLLYITINDLDDILNNDERIIPMKFVNLKRLYFEECDLMILRFFMNTQFEKIHVNFDSLLYSDLFYLKDLLYEQSINLTSLKLLNMNDRTNIFENEFCDKIKFHLHKLSIENFSFGYKDLFIEFLKQQSDTMENLEIERCYQFLNELILEVVFKEMRHLKSINLYVHEIKFHSYDIFNCMNEATEKLILNGDNKPTVLKKIINIYPNLKVLHLKYHTKLCDDVIRYSSSLEFLEELYLHYCRDQTFLNVELRNLKTIKINSIEK